MVLSSWQEDSFPRPAGAGSEMNCLLSTGHPLVKYINSNISCTPMSLLMFKYRIYPSSKQKIKIINSLKICKAIYNELLALSIDAWKFGKVSISGFDYNKYLTGKYPEIHSQVKQNVSDRVHKAFSNFFRRVKDKSCRKKGFPRFKSRINSITFPQSGFKLLPIKDCD